jgi:hypothetical protein
VAATFELPPDPALATLALQLYTLIRQSGRRLADLDLPDFHAFCHRVLQTDDATGRPAASMVRALANTFPGFNDQGRLHDGSRVILLKKATLAVGELRRLAAGHDPRFALSADAESAVAPMDNVVPAVLVYHGVVCLSKDLEAMIHHRQEPLPRGPQEAELRAVSLAACERIVQAAGHAFSPLDLGYYLWLHGKEPAIRRFARHHTRDTVFY